MWRIAKYAAWILPAAVVCATSLGCAFGDRKIRLDYKPAGTLKTTAPCCVNIVTFEDGRGSPEVGCVRNGYGMKTAKVLAMDPDGNQEKGQDIGAWVSKALAEELRQAGFEVREADAPPTGEKVVITGKVLDVYADLHMTIGTRIKVLVSITREGSPVVNNQVFSGDKSPLAWVASGGEYRSALEEALHDLMKTLIPVAIKAIE
jgi:hypothetical protein